MSDSCRAAHAVRRVPVKKAIGQVCSSKQAQKDFDRLAGVSEEDAEPPFDE